MCENWLAAHRSYNWKVDLTRFKNAERYPGFFNRIIDHANLAQFENDFRHHIQNHGSFEIAGEVCFWKNYGNYQIRNRTTHNLLEFLTDKQNWEKFVKVIKESTKNFIFENFLSLQAACNQLRGFVTPITFVAFCHPEKFPMVDKYIAFWWKDNRSSFEYDSSPKFFQRVDGWILADTNTNKKKKL